MSEEPLDQAIDEVARQMTAGQPSEDMRDRVIVRLTTNVEPRTTNTPGAWLGVRRWTLAPIAAAALVIVAMFVARGFQPRDASPERAAQHETPKGPAAQNETAPSTVRLPPSPRGGFGGTSEPDTTDTGSVARGFQPRERGPERAALRQAAMSTLDPTLKLDSIDVTPVTVDSLAPPAIVAPSIAVRALTTPSIALPQIEPIEPIVVAPLQAPESE